jgi:hypothetical protein
MEIDENFQYAVDSTPGFVLTALDPSGNAAWRAAGSGVTPGSVGAHGTVTGAPFALPASTSTAIPLDTIDSNPGGNWSLTTFGGQGALQTSTPGIFWVQVATNLQCNDLVGQSYATLEILNNGVVVSQQVVQGQNESTSPGTIEAVSASCVIPVSAGVPLSARVVVASSPYQIIYNLSGHTPANMIQWTIIQIAPF